MSDDLKPKTEKGQRTVAIIGQGYVGLPLALLFVKKGFNVLGIDLDLRKIEMLRKGKSYITEIQDREIKEAIESTKFTPTDQFSLMEAAEAIIICVPTPLTPYGTPDLSYLTQAATEIGSRLKKGQLVILESSTYPGTTKEVLVPVLVKSGLKAGSDFFVAYSPERVDPGNEKYPVESIPKVVSGSTENCLARVKELYSHIFEQVHSVSSTEAAELVKLLENSYRLVNISFINELAMICDVLHLNLWEIIDAAKTKPFGFNAFYPGPGIGGHCIPVDPSYLLWKIKQYGVDSTFIQIANAINHKMPSYVISQIKQHISQKSLENARVLIYGAAYKRDIADYRESSSIELIQLLLNERAEVFYHDPYIPSLQIGGEKLQSIDITEGILKTMDCVVIATDHSSIPLERIVEHSSFVYDTRNVTKGVQGNAKTIRLGGGA